VGESSQARSKDGASEISEQELIARCQAKEPDAIALLVERYQRYVYRLAYSLTGNGADADDLAQDAMINVLKGIGNFKGRSSLTSWIYVVVLNTFRDAKRRASRRPATSLENQPGGAEQQPTPLWNEGDTLLRKELAQVLQNVLAQVPEDFRTVVTLYDILGFSYEEIANMLGLPMGTVKSRLHRGRAFMRERLGNKTELLG
jgi:RNA polymerase sigma-70 factor (ECF subfamily)